MTKFSALFEKARALFYSDTWRSDKVSPVFENYSPVLALAALGFERFCEKVSAIFLVMDLAILILPILPNLT